MATMKVTVYKAGVTPAKRIHMDTRKRISSTRMCTSELPLQLCAGIVHDRAGSSLVVLMSKAGGRTMVFNHRGSHNFIARGDGQTVGCRKAG
jgi:hypothetical protein